MMKDIKNCCKLLKHGYQMKINAIAAIMFLLLGILYAIMDYEQFPLCVMYIFLAVSMAGQGMNMHLFSGYVAASPARKRIEFRYMDLINAILGAVGVIITLAISFCMEPSFCMDPVEMEYTCAETLLVVGGLAIIVLYVYVGMAYKLFVVSTFFFTASMMVIMLGTASFLDKILSPGLEGKRALAVAIFLVEFVIGLVLSGVVRRALYRKELSKWAAGAKLRAEQS